MSSVSPENRRRSQRVTVNEHVSVHTAGRRLRCLAINVSATGILIVPPKGAVYGRVLVVRLALNKSGILAINGTLARQTRIGDTLGWGIQFVKPPANLKRLLVQSGETSEPMRPNRTDVPSSSSSPSPSTVGSALRRRALAQHLRSWRKPKRGSEDNKPKTVND